MINGHDIEPTDASVLPPYHEQVDDNCDEARKEEVNIANAEKDEKHEEQVVHAMAKQALPEDAEKMIIVLQTAGITSPAEQDYWRGSTKNRWRISTRRDISNQ